MQAQRSGASSWQPPSDALILAATDRAERHRGRETPGVLLRDIADHLGIDWSPVASRRLRPLIDRLAREAGWLEHYRVHGLERWALTPPGLEELRTAFDDGVVDELPEAPQHRAWREARGRAERRLRALQASLASAIVELERLLEASAPAPSGAWRARIEPTTKAIEQLALAIECLHEWPEPDDREADPYAKTGRLGEQRPADSRTATMSADRDQGVVPASMTKSSGCFVRAPVADVTNNFDPDKVLGFGRPASVAIIFHPCEAAVVRAAVEEELAEYERRSTDEGEWDDHIGELRAMLDDIPARHLRHTFRVIWANALAHAVVRRALTIAMERVQTLGVDAGLAPLASAQATAAAATRTARALEAVDGGGRQEVWL